jgi:hypothetical protein
VVIRWLMPTYTTDTVGTHHILLEMTVWEPLARVMLTVWAHAGHEIDFQ